MRKIEQQWRDRLWAALGVEEGTFHRFTWAADWSGVNGLDQFGETVPFTGERWGQEYVPVADRERFAFYVALDDVEVSLVPRRFEDEGTVGRSGVMWVRLDTGAQMRRLQAFRPAPSVVLREGDTVRRTALWFVGPQPQVAQLDRGNRRLAHAVGSKKKFSDPGQLFHPPGTVLRFGRRKPVMVNVEFESGEVYTPGEVAGHLRDAPEPWTPELRVVA